MCDAPDTINIISGELEQSKSVDGQIPWPTSDNATGKTKMSHEITWSLLSYPLTIVKQAKSRDTNISPSREPRTNWRRDVTTSGSKGAVRLHSSISNILHPLTRTYVPPRRTSTSTRGGHLNFKGGARYATPRLGEGVTTHLRARGHPNTYRHLVVQLPVGCSGAVHPNCHNNIIYVCRVITDRVQGCVCRLDGR